MGREWSDLGGPALAYAQESPTRRDPHFCSPMRGSHRKPTQHSFCQVLLSKTLVDDTCITMVIHVVKFHSWQYALFRCRSLPLTYGRANV